MSPHDAPTINIAPMLPVIVKYLEVQRIIEAKVLDIPKPAPQTDIQRAYSGVNDVKAIRINAHVVKTILQVIIWPGERIIDKGVAITRPIPIKPENIDVSNGPFCTSQ